MKSGFKNDILYTIYEIGIEVEFYLMNGKKLHIHFIGIGGAGMSGLASIFLI